MSPTTLMPVFLSPGSVMVIPRLNREMVADLEALLFLSEFLQRERE